MERSLSSDEKELLRDAVEHEGLIPLLKVFAHGYRREQNRFLTMKLRPGAEDEVLYAKARLEGMRYMLTLNQELMGLDGEKYTNMVKLVVGEAED